MVVIVDDSFALSMSNSAEAFKDPVPEAGLGNDSLDDGSNEGQNGSSVAKTNEDFGMRPIVLAKRQVKHSKGKDKDKDRDSAASLASENEFQCRPIRLGSKNKQLLNESEETVVKPVDHSKKKKTIQIHNLPVVEPETKYDGSSSVSDAIFAVCVVDFHHARGPEIQWWKSNYCVDYPADNSLFKNLPFQALPDGSHLFLETFSNFNLVYDFLTGKSYDSGDDYSHFDKDPRNLKTLFGCSCVRQVKTSSLPKEEVDRNKDITRSIVQKAVVVIARGRPIFQVIKEKLSIITASYFLQNNFENTDLLEQLFADLNSNFTFKADESSPEQNWFPSKETTNKLNDQQDELFINLHLKEIVLKFRSSFLIIFKALLLEKRVLIYSNNNLEMLTQFQNNLISLIPNLINVLDNCGCPLSDYVESNGPLSKPDSLNTTSRKSMLRFFGLPLQVFNTKGIFWNPYLPLQQLSELNAPETIGFMVGCSNLLFVNQLVDLKVDVLVNLDSSDVSYPLLKPESLSLSSRDKKFIHYIINNIYENKNNIKANEHEPFIGSDDFIRYQFEDYILSLLSTTRFYQYKEKFHQPPPGFASYDTHDTKSKSDENHDKYEEPGLNSIDNGNIDLFNAKFMEEWFRSKNFKVWNAMADEFMFNFINPRHIGVDISDSSSPYAITSFFSNLKSKLNAPAVSSLDLNSSAQKYIPDTENTEEDPHIVILQQSKPTDSKGRSDQTHTSEKPLGKRISSWTSSWGFRKK